MRIAIGVPILNQPEMTQQFLDTLRANEGEHLPIILVDNGSTPPLRDWLIGLTEGDFVIRNDENVGVRTALNQIYQVAKPNFDYIIYLHNDVLIHEKDWDKKIIRNLAEDDNIGVAGFYGAKGIGVPGIYSVPYQIHQLVRTENVSNCIRMNAAVHGFRNIRGGKETEEVAVLDGFCLIVNMNLLKQTDGFDRNLPPHHMYDNDICLESIDRGFKNVVIAMDADHLGGRTDVGEDWTKPFNKSKADIHAEAHPIFYEKWRPGKHNRVTLPFRIV